MVDSTDLLFQIDSLGMELTEQGVRELDVADDGRDEAHDEKNEREVIMRNGVQDDGSEQGSGEFDKGKTDSVISQDKEGEQDKKDEEDVAETDAQDSSGVPAKNNTGGKDMPPPLEINYEHLKHIATHFMPGSHGACVDITYVKGGAFHEIRLLHFEDGWTCIARFPRFKESLYKAESELAATEYVRKHTKVPVPETFFVNHNRNHVVGSEFVLMEKMEGVKLCDLYDDIPLEHKISVIEQLAEMVFQLSELKFEKMGSLNSEFVVGPLLNPWKGTYEMYQDIEGPFTNVWDFFSAGLNEKRLHRPQLLMELYPEIKEFLQPVVADLASNYQSLQPPYRLVHSDLQLYNILVTQDDKTQPPKITGIIDWDWSFIGPLYYLFEFPEAITGNVTEDEDEVENKIVRKHFVKALAQHFPKDSADREMVRQCFRDKSSYITLALRYFVDWMNGELDDEVGCATGFLQEIRGDYGPYFPHHPYGCCEDWEPDSDLEYD